MERNYQALQNGSDIRGVALPGVPGEAVNLDIEQTFRLTAGFVRWLAARCGKRPEQLRISVGHDSRLSAEKLKSAMIRQLVHMGVKTLDCGLASTPAMFMSTVFPAYACDGAVMITASHLPFNRNGFKYFSRDGGLNKAEISAIIRDAEQLSDQEIACVCAGEARAADGSLEPAEQAQMAERRDLIGDYARHLREKIISEVADPDSPEKPLAGLHIIVDAGNGAGGFYATQILQPLGADIDGSQFLAPDGTFPNHAPNPENKEAMASICRQVKEKKADLGLIFDTDVDRVSAVDESGRQISRNAIVAMAAALIAREHPKTTVVTDSITSDELTEYLEQCLGLVHLRFKRGYRNVIDKAIALNESGIDSQLAIETSGHAAYKENYFLDDGAYLATKIVIKAAQLHRQQAKLSVILASLREPKEAVEYRFPIHAADFSAYADQVLAAVDAWARGDHKCAGASDGCQAVCLSPAEPNHEGVRVNVRGEGLCGWCLLRKSLHDPIMPLNIEVSEGSCADVLALLLGVLGAFDELDLTPARQ